MRVFLLSSAFVCASLVQGQTVVINNVSDAIQEAYLNTRASSSANTFMFEMRGTDSSVGVSIPVRAILYWRRSFDVRTGSDSSARVELDVYEGADKVESLKMRIVGDGTSLYRYDIDRREVATRTYGFYGTTPPGGYAGSDVPKLLAQLRTATPGLAAYLVRLLSEMDPAGFESPVRYAQWLPGRPLQLFDAVPVPIRTANITVSALQFVTDPVTGRRYYRGDSSKWNDIFEGMDRQDTDRTVTFVLYNTAGTDEPPDWVVSAVNVAERTTGRLVDLSIVPSAITPSLIPAWAFAPYAGVQAAAFRPIAAAP